MQKQKRLIYAEELERTLKNDVDFAIYAKGRNGDDELFIPISDVIGLLEQQPTIEAEPVRHGKWVRGFDWQENYSIYHCSECGEEPYYESDIVEEYKYCPYCGARMAE